MEELILDNQNLIHHIAKKYKGRAKRVGIDYDDMFQTGMIGLIKAANYFDESRGIKFSAYACNMINGYLLMLFNQLHHEGVKYSRKAKEHAVIIRNNEWENKTPEWIAEECEVDKKIIVEAFDYIWNRKPSNLDAEVDGKDGSTTTVAGLIGVDDDFTNVNTEEFLDSLTERERVITESLMLGMTQLEIAKKLSISRTYVSRLKDKIGKKLLSYMEVEDVSKGDMKKAKELLADTDMPIKKIAEETGCNVNSLYTYSSQYRGKKKDSKNMMVHVPKKESVKVDNSHQVIDELKREKKQLVLDKENVEQDNKKLTILVNERDAEIKKLKEQLQLNDNGTIIEQQQDMIDKLKAALKVFL